MSFFNSYPTTKHVPYRAHSAHRGGKGLQSSISMRNEIIKQAKLIIQKDKKSEKTSAKASSKFIATTETKPKKRLVSKYCLYFNRQVGS